MSKTLVSLFVLTLFFVHIKDFKFSPATLHVAAGDTVVFVNDDSEAHTATSLTRAFDSGGLDTNDRWQHRFAKPGSYSYICALHPYMKGAILVSAPTVRK
ncbi:MAG TPA: cupredoxin family copper-binding protein [Candidatus Baltobacteraceae bacterium]|jgi:plastocyanin